jgi:predicted PolB exonuclease-like 3'-5' exonuclease
MPTPFLVLDIETVLDPELPLAETETDRLPAPPHHRIVVIGALWFDPSYEIRRIGVVGDGKDERGILIDFASLMNDRKPCLVTYNGRSFDLPVIAARCLGYGIPLVHYYRSRDVRYRFSPEGHLDLMDYLADFGAAKPSRLDVIAKLCGLPGKVGVEGKNVGPMVHAGRLAEVRNYCLCDVVQTAGVFLRVQLVRGELSHPGYREAMGQLVRLIRADPRLAPVAAGLDEPRLMLDEPSPGEVFDAAAPSQAAAGQVGSNQVGSTQVGGTGHVGPAPETQGSR